MPSKVVCEGNCGYDFEALKEIVPEALALVTNASICGFYRLAVRTIDAYSAGLCCGTEEFKRMYIDHIGRWKTSQSGELVSLWTV